MLPAIAACSLAAGSAAAAPPAFGVRWTARVPIGESISPTSSGDPTSWPTVVGDAVYVLVHDVLATYDLHTGASRTRPAAGWRYVLAAGGQLVVLGADGLFGVDPATLAPTWRVASQARIAWAFGDLVADDPGPDHRFIARHAGDGKVAWETTVDDTVHQVVADGPTVYLGARNVFAIDAATGRERWRTRSSYIFSAAGGRVVLSAAAPRTAEVHAGDDGRVLATIAGGRAWFGPDYRIDGSAKDLAAPGRWQRAIQSSVVALDDAWVFAVDHTDPLATFVVLDAATGQPALSFPIEALDYQTAVRVPARKPGDPRLVLVVGKRWLVALGEVPAPAPPRPAAIVGRLLRPHCTHDQPDDRPPVPLAHFQVEIAGARAKTDAAGRFTLAVAGATGAPVAVRYQEKPWYDLPRVLVPDGQPVEFTAFYEYGCH